MIEMGGEVITPVTHLRAEDIRDLSAAQLAEKLAFCEGQQLTQMSDDRDGLWEAIQQSGKNAGPPLPWDLFDDVWGWRPGELTLMAGPNNSGKSSLLSFMALHYSRYGKVGMMSLEEPFPEQARRFLQQAWRQQEPTRDQFEQLCDFTHDRIFHYQHHGMVQAPRVYGCMEAFRARGCNLVIIDNLQKCGVTEDLDQQRDFVNNLIGLATAMQLHVVVVHHTRKRSAGYHGRISSDDVRGSGAITDMAINTLLVERDFDRAAALQKKLRGESLTPDEQDLLEDGCDITLWVQKQKFGTRWNGPIRLWTDAGMTYKDAPNGNLPALPLRPVRDEL